MAKSLWADLSELELVRSPRTVLLEQAQYLTQATKGMLVGTVQGDASRTMNFHYTLDVKVPAINNYSVTVLGVNHDLNFYPVQLLSNWTKTELMCPDEASFEREIASVLSSREVKGLLSRLLSQVK